MLIRITNHLGKIVSEQETDSHAKAIKNYSVNPMKKCTAREFDFVVDTLNGSVERSYWIFK